MLIRSQGKIGIINLDCVEAVGIEKDNTIRAYGNDRVYELGEYSTEEKAIKVLDMIQEKARWDGRVFEMPQDEEV